MVENSNSSQDNQQKQSQIGKKIKESANQIWLAGLGAYSKAEQEGGKLFEALVKDGERLEDFTKGTIDKTVSSYKGRVDDVIERVENVRDKATGSWEKIEKAFDERVASALGRLNIPTRKEVEALSATVDELRKEVAKLSKSTGSGSKAATSAKAAPKKKAAVKKKAVAKKSVAKKSVAKKS